MGESAEGLEIGEREVVRGGDWRVEGDGAEDDGFGL